MIATDTTLTGRMKLSIVVVLQFVWWPIEGARILVYSPYPGKSYHHVLRPLLRELSVRGHHITAVTPFPLEDPPSTYQEIIVENVMDEVQGDFEQQVSGKDIVNEKTKKKGKVGMMSMMHMSNLEIMTKLHNMALNIQEKWAQMEEVKKLIHSDLKFDAVITNSAALQESGAVFQHKFGAVGIEVIPFSVSHWVNHIYGNPNNPSFIVDYKSPYTDRMNFLERIHNTGLYILNCLFAEVYYMPKVQELADKYFNYTGWESRPPVMDLLSNKSLVLISTHFSVNYPYPLSPHIVEVGGLNILPNKPLPKDIQEFMDEAKDGVIVFSLGSVVEVSTVLEKDLLKAFVGALGKLKQRIIWKWEEKEFPNKPENVKAVAWLPQQDILAHKNCRLFITHCGYSSIVEAVHYGVPLVGIPLFGDQVKNAIQIAAVGNGIKIDFDNVTEQSISWAVNEVLSNPLYRKVAKERSILFRDRIMSPLDTAIYWIEYVIRHKGAPHLRTALTTLAWYQSTSLDVGLVVTSSIVLALYLICLIIRGCCRLICGRKPKLIEEGKHSKKLN